MKQLASLAIFIAVCLLPMAVVTAQTSEVIKEDFQKIKKEYKEQVKEADGDRKKLRKLRSSTSDTVLEMADGCEDAGLAIDMLNWVIELNPRTNRKTKKAFAIIADQFLDQPGITDLLTEKTDKEFLETVLAENEDAEVKVVARFLMALKDRDEEVREKVLKELLAEHADVVYRGKKMKKHIAGPLAALRFRVGKVAPDIEGPDTDGVEFKLSDYRGKIVVVDFWGDW